MFGLVLIQGATAASPSEDTLDRLGQASSQQEADALEKDIWDIWLEQAGPTVDILMTRGVDAQARGDTELARDMYDRVILINPDYAEVWNRRAALFFSKGQYDEAIADLEEALKRQPRHFGAWIGLGVIFEALEENDAALAAYRSALAIHPFASAARAGEKRLVPIVEGRSL